MAAVVTPTPADTVPRPGMAGGTVLGRIIVIDDDEVMLLSCRRILEKEGYAVETFASALAGIDRVAEARPELVLVDLKMPEISGMEVIQRIRAIDPGIVIAVVTGYATIATAVEAMGNGAHDFVPKPFTPDELRLAVKRAAERRRLIEESERHRREREAAERRIVTFVSHQLKSPVAAAKQCLDVLLFTSRAELPPVGLEWIGRAQTRLQEMVTMIDDWLTFARLERSTVCAIDATAGLCDVVTATTQAIAAHAAAADVSVECDLPSEDPRVCGDAASIAMLVSNLLTNAIKYNQPGGRVTIRVSAEPSAAMLDVSDTGIGIDPESLPHVFDEFYRASDVKSRGVPGSGLGLAICRRIVTELGGAIGVTSTPGLGTTFTVRLPLAGSRA
jgi:two-component system, sensor histidine kinase and response regulator